MNVIISNKYQDNLSKLDIDIIKNLNGEFSAEELISNFKNFFFNKMILDITALKDYKDLTNLKKIADNFDCSKIILFLNEECNQQSYIFQIISMGFYNFTNDVEKLKTLVNNSNTYQDVSYILDNNNVNNVDNNQTISTKIIGFKNVTESAGATTLVYILKKYLEKNYKVMAIELNKNDFSLFNDKDLISTDDDRYEDIIIKGKEKDIILMDLNNSKEDEDCDEIFYLVEPSTVKLNKLIRRNKNAFTELRGKNVVLNKSLLNSKDIKEFEYESKSKVFFNMPPLNDKVFTNDIVNEFLSKLGLIRQQSVKPKRFKWFK